MYSKELEDLRESLYQRAKSEKEKAKADLYEKVESFYQKIILGEGAGLVGGEKEWLKKRVRESLNAEYVDIPSTKAKDVDKSLKATQDKLNDYETEMRRAQDKIKTLSDRELWNKYLEAKNSIEYEGKPDRE